MSLNYRNPRPFLNLAGVSLSLLLGACGGAEVSSDSTGGNLSLGRLSLEVGNNIEFNAVPLEDGTFGIEIIEEGQPGTPSVLNSEELVDVNPLELYLALAPEQAEVPDLLHEMFELSSSAEQGWFRAQWADLKPDVERYSCGDTWFGNLCSQGSYNHRAKRLNHNGTYYHQKTGGITDYRSRACSQGSATYQYRIRRKANSGSNYVNWTKNISPGQYYNYRWVSNSGVYRFRTELNRGSASSSSMRTDVCVNYNLKNDPQALECEHLNDSSDICSCNGLSGTWLYSVCIGWLEAACGQTTNGEALCPRS